MTRVCVQHARHLRRGAASQGARPAREDRRGQAAAGEGQDRTRVGVANFCLYQMLNMLFNNLYHRRDCKEQEALKAAILKEIPEAQVEFLVGEGGELDN